MPPDTKLVDQQMLVEAKPGGGGSVFLTSPLVRGRKVLVNEEN